MNLICRRRRLRNSQVSFGAQFSQSVCEVATTVQEFRIAAQRPEKQCRRLAGRLFRFMRIVAAIGSRPQIAAKSGASTQRSIARAAGPHSFSKGSGSALGNPAGDRRGMFSFDAVFL